eukprot:5251241-Amphidinium_carterae.1
MMSFMRQLIDAAPAPELEQLSAIFDNTTRHDGLHIAGQFVSDWTDIGVPLGTPSYVDSLFSRLWLRLLEQKFAVSDGLMQYSSEFATTYQVVLCIRRNFYPAVLMHFMRAVPTPSMQPMLQQLQGTIVRACELLLGSTISDQLSQLGQLPTALGGIGMPNLPQYWASLLAPQRFAQLNAYLMQVGQHPAATSTWTVSTQSGCTTVSDPESSRRLNDTVTFARWSHELDHYGCHALTCSKHLHTRRQNMLGDHIAAFARSAGLYTQVEQLMDPQIAERILPDETQTSAAPSGRRPVQHCLPQQHLQLTASRKAAEYACTGVTPVVFLTDGGYDAGTFALIQRLRALRLRKLVVDSPEMDMLSLNQQVQQEFFEPISCILDRSLAAAIAACLGDSKLQESAVKQVRARHQTTHSLLPLVQQKLPRPADLQQRPLLPLHDLRGPQPCSAAKLLLMCCFLTVSL